MTNYRIDASRDIGPALTGLDSATGNGYLQYKVINAAGAVIIAATNAGIVEIDGGAGLYAVTGGISVPYNDTYFTRWSNSNTGDHYGGDDSQPNNQANDLLTAIGEGGGGTDYTLDQIAAAVWAYAERNLTDFGGIVTAVLAAIGSAQVIQAVQAGTMAVFSGPYIAIPAGYSVAVRAGAASQVLTINCSYQGAPIVFGSAPTLRIWQGGNTPDTYNDALTINEGGSLGVMFSSTDLTVPGPYLFEITGVDTNGNPVIVPNVCHGKLLVTDPIN